MSWFGYTALEFLYTWMLQNAMQHDVDLIHEWLCRNILSLNAVKTCYVTFGRAKNISDLTINVDGTDISRVDKYKYLGLVIDDELNFSAHVDHVKKQITPFISLMWRKGKYIPMARRKEIYSAYVHNHLTYMLPIYSECAGYKLKQLQTLQNRSIKAMYRLDRLTPTTYLYSTRLLPISELVKVERIVCVHKLINSRTKHNFRFVVNADVHSRLTRRNSQLHVFNQHSSSNLSNAALVAALCDFNSMDSDIRHTQCLKTFKAKVRLKVMTLSEKFSAISPFFYVN